MLQPSFKPKTILVPTDFSPSADTALSTAAQLARDFGSAIYLLNVIPMFPIVAESGYSSVFPEEKYLEYTKRFATEKLLASTKTLHTEGIEAAFGIEIGNDVVGSILMVLERQRADLIILSTHGLSGWRPMIFGSTAEKIIKLVQCPLLLLRSVSLGA